jgi:hypothetical protein
VAGIHDCSCEEPRAAAGTYFEFRSQYVAAIAAHPLRTCSKPTPSSIAPQPQYQGLLATKQRQYSVADELGLPVPKTCFVRSLDETMAFAATARFPVILKPLHFREWKSIPREHPLFEKKLIVIQSAADLEQQYRLAAASMPIW